MSLSGSLCAGPQGERRKPRHKPKLEKTKREAFPEGRTGVEAPLIDPWNAEHYEGPEDILGQEGWLAQLTKAVGGVR